ncbi:MAG: nitrogen regulation protein NR(I) [Nitrospinae bacterium]|nr:nitrogen regulation protein NR(I) [Nitrospinota bacterium]
MKNILVVDDEESLRWVLKKGLEKKGYTVHTAENGKDALSSLSKNEYLMAFLDIFLPDGNGLQILDSIKKQRRDITVVIMTAQGTMKNAIEAMQKGAYDYITKPFDMEEIYLLIDKVENLKKLERKVHTLEEEIKTKYDTDEIVGRSQKMQKVFKTIGKAASSDLPVLITGESGTGKELVARALHKASKRSAGPFVAVNCAAIPKELLESELFGYEKGAFTGASESRGGKFEIADGGTLFLDEIGDMDVSLQAKLLRVIQEMEFYRIGGRTQVKVDARIIAATNQQMETAIEEKRFREDLYHRLNVITIPMPPLRERREDIPVLSDYFLRRFGKDLGSEVRHITEDAMDILKNYEWKGNVRELENVIKRAIVMSGGDSILPEQLPITEHAKSSSVSIHDMIRTRVQNIVDKGNLYNEVIGEIERELLLAILKRTEWNQVKAAEILGINRNTLSRKIKELGIKGKDMDTD